MPVAPGATGAAPSRPAPSPVGRGMRWDGPAPLQSGNAELQGKLYLQTIARENTEAWLRRQLEALGEKEGWRARAPIRHCVPGPPLWNDRCLPAKRGWAAARVGILLRSPDDGGPGGDHARRCPGAREIRSH